MERPSGARRGAGCGPHTRRTHRQADQCGFSKRVIDAACQHHDPGTYDGFHVAFACAVTAAGRIGVADRGCGQETGRAQGHPRSDAGPDTDVSGASGLLRLIPANIPVLAFA